MPEWFSFRLWKNARNIYVRGGFLKVIPSGRSAKNGFLKKYQTGTLWVGMGSNP